MTHTISPSASAAATSAAATGTGTAARGLLACAAVAGPLFLAVGITHGLAREGFDFTRNAISQLSLGDPGWIQIADFLVAGTLLITGAIGMRRSLTAGPGHRAAPWLVGVFGPRSWSARCSRPTPEPASRSARPTPRPPR